MARGGRPRTVTRRFTSKPPRPTRPRPTKVTKMATRPRPPTRVKTRKFAKVVTKARGRKQVKFVTKRPITKRPKPTRITVSSPSGKVGKTVTVSSRSILGKNKERKRLNKLRKEGAFGFGVNINFGESSNKGFEGFGVGDRVSNRVRKGGVEQIRLTSKDGTRSRQFNIPANRFDRSARDPTRVGLFAGTGKPTQRTKKPKRVFTRRKFIRRKPPTRPRRRSGSDFDVLNFFA